MKKQHHIKLILASILFILLSVLAVHMVTNRAQAAPAISEEQAIAIATGQEVGDNDFPISNMGGDERYDAFASAVVYNSRDNEYLVVWYSDDNASQPGGAVMADQEFEIYGQRVDATTGQPMDSQFRISDMGPDGNTAYYAKRPTVAYDSNLNQYLVVWGGDDNTNSLVDDEYEIFGQLLLADGTEIGTNDFRVSNIGPQFDTTFWTSDADVVYNAAQQEYLVVWVGNDQLTPGGELEMEIFGQRLDAATGAEVGDNDFRISNMGPDGEEDFRAAYPAVAYNSAVNQYLVIWEGDEESETQVDNEFEIFGQLLTANGTELGDDVRITHWAFDTNPDYGAYRPDVAYNIASNEYMVVWVGEDQLITSGALELEIYGQRINALNVQNVDEVFRISVMGPDGSNEFEADYPTISYRPNSESYLVTWQGNDSLGVELGPEYEIYGQQLLADGSPTGQDDFPISDMGPAGDGEYSANRPAVACQTTTDQCLVTWRGDDDIAPLVEGEYEIFSQLLQADGTETGLNDRRLSYMGGDEMYDAFEPAVAYNTKDDEYMVVWHGDDSNNGMVNGEFEIFGRRVDAETGQPLSDEFRISTMGPNGNDDYGANRAAIAYNPTLNQYLVVWSGNESLLAPFLPKYEIFGQLLLADGSPTGSDDFPISNMAQGSSNGTAKAVFPDVTYNPLTKQYLVVWEGVKDLTNADKYEREIFGQLLLENGNPTGADDFPISDMGPTGVVIYGAFDPAVAYNAVQNQYLVVWHGDDDKAPLVNDEYEIFGQLLQSDGSTTGENDFRISDMGPNGSDAYAAFSADVAYNPTLNQYLVVWRGDDNQDSLVLEEYEIFGQRLLADGTVTGDNDFRISDMGSNGDIDFEASNPAVTYNLATGEYLVVWHGDDDSGQLVFAEYEIFGQRLDGDGTETGSNDFRISNMGPDGNIDYDASNPAVACQTATTPCLVVWWGDDDTLPLVNDEFEIFGQFYGNTGSTIYLPLVVKP